MEREKEGRKSTIQFQNKKHRCREQFSKELMLQRGWLRGWQEKVTRVRKVTPAWGFPEAGESDQKSLYDEMQRQWHSGLCGEKGGLWGRAGTSVSPSTRSGHSPASGLLALLTGLSVRGSLPSVGLSAAAGNGLPVWTGEVAEVPFGPCLVFLCITWDAAWCGGKDAGLEHQKTRSPPELGH